MSSYVVAECCEAAFIVKGFSIDVAAEVAEGARGDSAARQWQLVMCYIGSVDPVVVRFHTAATELKYNLNLERAL